MLKRRLVLLLACLMSCNKSINVGGGLAVERKSTAPQVILANQHRCQDEWQYELLPDRTTLRVVFYEPGYQFDLMNFPDLIVGIISSSDTVRVLGKQTGQFSRVSFKKNRLVKKALIKPGDLIGIEQDSGVAREFPALAHQKGWDGLRIVGCSLPGILYNDSLGVDAQSICDVKKTYFVKINFTPPPKR